MYLTQEWLNTPHVRIVWRTSQVGSFCSRAVVETILAYIRTEPPAPRHEIKHGGLGASCL